MGDEKASSLHTVEDEGPLVPSNEFMGHVILRISRVRKFPRVLDRDDWRLLGKVQVIGRVRLRTALIHLNHHVGHSAFVFPSPSLVYLFLIRYAVKVVGVLSSSYEVRISRPERHRSKYQDHIE